MNARIRIFSIPFQQLRDQGTADLHGQLFRGVFAKGEDQRSPGRDIWLGVQPVEYRGAKIPAPDERRHYS